LFFWFEIVEGEAAEIGKQNIARNLVASVAFVEVADVGECLRFGGL